MRSLMSGLMLMVLFGCGAETATTAATAAAAKKRETDDASRTMDRARAGIEKATEQMHQRAESASEK